MGEKNLNNLPLVTIGIPNYNYAHYILETLNSVANQTYQNIELIIVDDVSTDNSIEVIEKWIDNYSGNTKIRFIKNEINQGLSAVSNIILNNASGKYFQPLDADDMILPEKIMKQVSILENSSNAALIYSNVAVINGDGEITNPNYCKRIRYDKDNMPNGSIFNDLLKFNFISLPSVLINTAFARKSGGFDNTLQVQDYYMWLKLAEKYEIKYLKETTAHYRVHENSMSNFIKSSLVSNDSVLRIKYAYFDQANPQLKKVIAKNIQNSSVLLYQHKYPTAKKWISLAFKLNPGFKTIVYYFSIRLGIPFSFFNNIKSILNTLRREVSFI